MGRRALLEAVVADLRDGACSVLEHAFLTDVDRAHGLPAGRRQVQASSKGTTGRDVLYEAFALAVELDGHTHHSSLADRVRDLDRDLDAALDDLLTIRLGWGLLPRACETTARLGRLRQRRGWDGSVVPCSRCEPPVAHGRGGPSAAGGRLVARPDR